MKSTTADVEINHPSMLQIGPNAHLLSVEFEVVVGEWEFEAVGNQTSPCHVSADTNELRYTSTSHQLLDKF